MDSKSELLKQKKNLEAKLKNPNLAEYKKMFEDGIKEVEKKIEALGKDVVKDVEKVVDKPKAKRKPRAKKKTTTKLTKSEEEKAKADLKKKTGKTEEECEEIIEQYKALRTKAQTRKKKETATAKKDKERVDTLKKKGDIIEGTNVKTADATIETTKEEVVEKIDKEVEVVKEKAEKKAEKEVKKKMPKATKTEQKKEVEKKVEKEVKAKTKTIVKRIVIDTSDLINTISDKLGKLDKDSQKEFLIKLRSDVDKLLKKYAIGGLTDGAITTMNVTQSNMSASSVNPTLFEKGGSTYNKRTESYIVTNKDDRHYNQIGVADYGIETDSKGQEFVTLSFDNGTSTYSVEDVNKTYAKGGIMADGRIVLRDFNGIGGNKNKTYKLIKDDRDSDGKPYYTLIEYPSENVMAQGDSFEEVNGYANLMSGKFAKGGSTYAKDGDIKGYSGGYDVTIFYKNGSQTVIEGGLPYLEALRIAKKQKIENDVEDVAVIVTDQSSMPYGEQTIRWISGSTYAKGGGIGFSNSNLYFKGFGKDINGNSVIKVYFPNSRAFSIQTNGNLPETHSIKMEYSKIEKVPASDLKVIEKEVTEYIKEYGTDTQKRKLNTYAKGGMIDAPRIYVADLEAYNNGVLKGEWLDLNDYSFADELMDAIEEVVGDNEYAIHDVEGIPSSMYSEYMGRRDFEELYEMIELANDNDLPLDVVIEVVNQYDENIVDTIQGQYNSMREFAEQLADDIGIENLSNPEQYVYMTDTDRRLTAQDMADSYVDDMAYEDGGKRIIEEAELDVDEFDEADEDRQEEMIDEAREIVYDEYYDSVYESLDDPYYYFVEEQGIYSREDFFNSNLVLIDYDALADDLEYDYLSIYGEDGSVYIFEANYKRGGKVKRGKRSKHSYMQDRRRVSSEPWEVAYQKRKRRNKK